MTAKRKSKNQGKKRAGPRTANHEKPLRRQLKDALAWSDAHVNWKTALSDLPPEKRGVRPQGSPHSPWELLEHARISQHDILDFCRNPKYKAMEWPAGYWPKSPAPPDDSAWDKAVQALAADSHAMAKLIEDPKTDLFAKIP